MVEPRASFSIPAKHAKFDCKQATFHIPIFLLPVTRQIFYKRYVCDIGQRVAYSADWADLTRTNRRLEVAGSGDLEPIARELPSNDLFKTRIRVTLGSAKAVTITVYYTTGTVQGNRCTSWVRKEFSALMDTIRAMYILANHHTQPDLHKEVDEGLRLLPLPSPDRTSTQTTNAGDSGTRPPFVTALLAKAVLSPTPSVTGGCPPATLTPAITTHQSPRPSHPTQTQPNGGQQETTNRRSDLETTKAKYSHTTPHHLLNSNTPPRAQSTSKKTHAKRSKPTKGIYIIRKQATNPYSLTKKINTLAAAVRNISNVVCALQQVCTLSNENVTLKTVIKNLKNQSTSSSQPTPDCSSDPQVPAASKPASTRQTKKSEDLSEQQRARSSSKTPSTVSHQTTKTTQQRPETTSRPATSDLADSTSRRTAAAMPQRRATEDSRPAATSGHANSTTRFTAASPRQHLAELLSLA